MQAEEKIYRRTEDGKLLRVYRGDLTRPCNHHEEPFARDTRSSQALMHQLVEFRSTNPITDEEVEEAFQAVLSAYPHLQQCVAKHRGKWWFKLMERQQFHLQFAQGSIDDTFRSGFKTSFDKISGPLWKMTFVRPMEASTDCKYGIIVTGEHTLTDVYTNISVLGFMVRYLANDPKARTAEPQPIPSETNHLMSKPILQMYPNFSKFWNMAGVDMLRHVVPRKSVLFRNLENSGGDLPLRELYDCFTEEETKILLTKCKAKGVSINSAISIATSIATVRAGTANEKVKKKLHQVITIHPINVRRELEKELQDQIGMLSSLIKTRYMSSTDLDSTFWVQAAEANKDLKERVDNKEWMPSQKMAAIQRYFKRKNEERVIEGKSLTHNTHILFNNMGRIDGFFSMHPESSIEVTRFRRAHITSNWGILYLLGFETFQKKLQVFVSYKHLNITTESVELIFNNVMSILREIIHNDNF